MLAQRLAGGERLAHQTDIRSFPILSDDSVSESRIPLLILHDLALKDFIACNLGIDPHLVSWFHVIS